MPRRFADQQSVARVGEFGRNTLSHLGRCGRVYEAGVSEMSGGALVAAGQPVDEEVGFTTAGDFGASRRDGAEHGKFAWRGRQGRRRGGRHWWYSFAGAISLDREASGQASELICRLFEHQLAAAGLPEPTAVAQPLHNRLTRQFFGVAGSGLRRKKSHMRWVMSGWSAPVGHRCPAW
jgi:hypothetical protein